VGLSFDLDEVVSTLGPVLKQKVPFLLELLSLRLEPLSVLSSHFVILLLLYL